MALLTERPRGQFDVAEDKSGVKTRRTQRTIVITVRRPVAGYNFASLWPYANAVNNADLLLPDGNTVPEGAAKFKMPAMADRVTTAESCFIELKFDCRPGVKPWRKNVIDQGAEGWAQDDAGKFFRGVFTTDAAAASPAGVILLDGEGFPMRPLTFSKVISPDQNGKPYNTSSPPYAVPAEDVVDPDLSSSTLKVLSFRRNAAMDLNDLLA